MTRRPPGKTLGAAAPSRGRPGLGLGAVAALALGSGMLLAAWLEPAAARPASERSQASLAAQGSAPPVYVRKTGRQVVGAPGRCHWAVEGETLRAGPGGRPSDGKLGELEYYLYLPLVTCEQREPTAESTSDHVASAVPTATASSTRSSPTTVVPTAATPTSTSTLPTASATGVSPSPTFTANATEDTPTASRTAASTITPTATAPLPPGIEFDGPRSFAHAEAQCDLGPRPPGSPAHRQTADYVAEHLASESWVVEVDTFEYRGVELRNVIGRKGQGPPLLVGAHYDTRLVADLDPDLGRRSEPIAGGNDGASGVAVLLELASVLDVEGLGYEIGLTFFDAEDQGGAAGWDWFVGSTRVAKSMFRDHDADFAGLVLIDMIGDLEQRVCRAADSTSRLTDPVFAAAVELGYGDWLRPECRYYVSDDHTPFLDRGLPAADLIDFEYPYWHTHADTCDKIGPEPLARVGRTLEYWLESGAAGAGR